MLYLIQISDRSVAIETGASFDTEWLVQNAQDALEIPDVVLLRTPTLTARRAVQASISEIYSFRNEASGAVHESRNEPRIRFRRCSARNEHRVLRPEPVTAADASPVLRAVAI